MQDLVAKLEKYRLEAEDCEIISKLSGDVKKRAFFARLSVQFRQLARDIEEQIAARERDGPTRSTRNDPSLPSH